MAAKKKDSGKFIKSAFDKMKKKGTAGSFKKAAKHAGKSTKELVGSTLKAGSKATPKMKKKAQFLRNIGIGQSDEAREAKMSPKQLKAHEKKEKKQMGAKKFAKHEAAEKKVAKKKAKA